NFVSVHVLQRQAPPDPQNTARNVLKQAPALNATGRVSFHDKVFVEKNSCVSPPAVFCSESGLSLRPNYQIADFVSRAGIGQNQIAGLTQSEIWHKHKLARLFGKQVDGHSGSGIPSAIGIDSELRHNTAQSSVMRSWEPPLSLRSPRHARRLQPCPTRERPLSAWQKEEHSPFRRRRQSLTSWK